jgi:hypothetical protein
MMTINVHASSDEADSGQIAEYGDVQIEEATVEVQSDDGNKFEYSVKAINPNRMIQKCPHLQMEAV